MNEEDLKTLEKKHKNYTEVKLDGVCLNRTPDSEKELIEDLDVAEEDILLIELPKSLKPDVFVFVSSSQTPGG